MSARGQKKGRRTRRATWYDSHWLGGLLQWAVAAYLALSLTGPSAAWWRSLLGVETVDLLPIGNAGGPVGAVANLALRVVFGAAWCWFLPLLLAVGGFSLLLQRRGLAKSLAVRVIPIWIASAAWLAQPQGALGTEGGAAWGGIIGVWLGRGFHFLFGLWGGRIFLTFLLLTALLVGLQPLLSPLWRRLTALQRGVAFLAGLLRTFLAAVLTGLVRIWDWCRGWGSYLLEQLSRREEPEPDESQAPERAGRHVAAAGGNKRERAAVAAMAPSSPGGDHGGRTASSGSTASRVVAGKRERKTDKSVTKDGSPPISLPGLDLLHEAGLDLQSSSPAALDAAADLLEETLRSFGVVGEVKEVRPGPVVTTFEYQPASGIKVSQIVQRADDLALAMKARSIRMEAPIPGKAAVGIEIPNNTAQIVRLKEVLELMGDGLTRPLAVVLGKDVVGKPIVIDIGALPHLLVAGSTGSGKSVCLNAIICNLLLRNDPSRVRLLLIDPKMLEMSVYNGLPHLLLPVVTDPKQALRALKWMVSQMDLRYRKLARVGVRDIEGYNRKIEKGEVVGDDGEPVTKPMPYYLTIVDELADLMMLLGQEVELPVTRLAQKARAVGIHLILATQRPSVDVLTGVIKANIPCRIAFRVIQKNDSRTILDMNGAEQLLGHGDMLFLQPGRALPKRVHGAFIDVDECEALVAHWSQFADMTSQISLEEDASAGGFHTGEDDLFEDAKRIVVLHQSGSTSLLQRRLRVGYTRAGRLMDMLEEAGVVGPFTGSKARDVLLKPEEIEDAPGVRADEGQA